MPDSPIPQTFKERLQLIVQNCKTIYDLFELRINLKSLASELSTLKQSHENVTPLNKADTGGSYGEKLPTPLAQAESIEAPNARKEVPSALEKYEAIKATLRELSMFKNNDPSQKQKDPKMDDYLNDFDIILKVIKNPKVKAKEMEKFTIEMQTTANALKPATDKVREMEASFRNRSGLLTRNMHTKADKIRDAMRDMPIEERAKVLTSTTPTAVDKALNWERKIGISPDSLKIFQNFKKEAQTTAKQEASTNKKDDEYKPTV